MHRIYPLLHKLIDYYPYFQEMASSTNFSYDSWLDEFMGLMNLFGEYPERIFHYKLQLSIDGPEYINDANRGQGVTKHCIANFDKLLQVFKDGKFPKNVMLFISIKGTWDLDCIRKLNDKEKLIEFYKFYEDAYIDKVYQLNLPQLICGTSVPNTAVPAPTTKEDGQIFAELIKKCREIEQENKVLKYFKYYDKITPFSQYTCERGTYTGTCCGCGSGQVMVGFLPYDMISACHEGFTLIVDKYKEYATKRSDKDLTVSLNKFFKDQPIPMCLTDEQYITHENKMSYLDKTSPAQVSASVTHILALAMAGLIDQKYLDEREALDAACYILQNTAFCIKANYMITGSFAAEPFDLYVLLLNGALEYLKEDIPEMYNGGCDGKQCNTCR